MKDKNKLPVVGNGVRINYCKTSSLSTNERIKIPFFNEFMQMVLVIIAAVGAIMTFTTILVINVETFPVIITIAIAAAAYTVLFKKIKKRYIVILATIGILAAMFLFAYSNVSKGFNIAYQQAYLTICKYMYWDIPELSFEWDAALYSSTNLAIGMIAVLLTCFLTYFTTVKLSFLAIFLLTFPFFEIGAAFGCVPNYYYFALMLSSWTASLTLYQANNAKVRVKSRDGKKSEHKVFGTGAGRFAGSAIIIAAITVGLFLGGRAVLNNIGFNRSEKVDTLREDVKDKADDTIDYILGQDNDGSLKEGKLLQIDDHRVKNRHYITMKTTMQNIDESLYVKGYSATVYTGTEWQQTSNYKKYDEMFSKLKAMSFRMGGISGSLLSQCEDYAQIDSARITFSDFRRKKDYAYSMYTADFDDNYKELYDYALTPNDKEKYSYNSYIGYENIFKVNTSALYKQKSFKELWNQYSSFVKQEYTISSQSDKVRDLVYSMDTSNPYKLVDEIRNYLAENVKYTFIVDKSPANKDFVENLLFNTKCGYSTHYATAAAVMLQTAGVPTRYVEGYCVLPKSFEKIESDNKYGYKTVDLTDEYAHAWIEVYDDTFGWIPVDVTPGFYSGSFYDLMKKHLNNEEEPEEEPQQQNEQNTEQPEEEPEPEMDIEFAEYEEPVKLPVFVYILIAIAAALLLFVISVVTVYVIITARRKKKLNSPEPNIKAYAAYKYLLSLLKYEGISAFASYSDLVKKATKKSELLSESSLAPIIGLMLKSGFSQTGITLEQSAEAVDFVIDYANALYKKQSLFKRIKFRFFKMLK